MSEITELKRAASEAKNWGGEVGEGRWYTAECFKRPYFSIPDAEFIAACEPGAVLALIAENDAALREATSLAMAIWRRRYAKDSPNFQPFEKASSVIGQIDNMAAGLMSDLEKLRAEVAGLRTGYEAYERVNAELKAEVERLDKLLIDAAGTLRKASSWICRDVEVGTKSATHWAIRLRETADQIDAALGQGEQS